MLKQPIHTRGAKKTTANLTLAQQLQQELEAICYQPNFLDKFDLSEIIDVTAVIPTYNRCPYDPKTPEGKLNPLYWSLNSLLAQRPQLQEIIVIDDNSKDFTPKLLKQMKEKARTKQIKFLVIRKKTKKGSSHARNLGIKKANSNFVFFMDDDNLAPKYSAFCAFHTLKTLSREGVKVGVVHLPIYHRATFPKGVIKADQIARLNFTKGKYSSNFDKFPKEYLDNSDKFLDDHLKILKPIQIQNLAGCFLAPKKRLLAVNGFPDFFTWKNSYGEESELACRLMANGYSLFFCPDPKFGLYHGKYGEPAKIPINKKLFKQHKHKHLIDNLSLLTLNRECAQTKDNTGNRVSAEDWYYSKIISFFIIFYPRNMKGALNWVAYTKRVFVDQSQPRKFARGKWTYIKDREQRERIWYKAILDGLELATKKDKNEVWEFLKGLEEIRDFNRHSKLGALLIDE